MDHLVSGTAAFQACYVQPPTMVVTSQTWTARFNFPPDLPVFAGHFPNDPILPGFMQIELALDLLRRLKMGGQLQAVRQARFFLPIRPGRNVDVSLEALADHRFHLELKADGELCAVMEITAS